MQRHSIARVETEGIHDGGNFLLIPDLEHQLAGCGKAGIAVKFQIKGSVEQFWQNIGKFPAFRDDFNTIILKAVAVKQNTEAFRQCTASLAGHNTADLRLRGSRKRNRHGRSPLS